MLKKCLISYCKISLWKRDQNFLFNLKSNTIFSDTFYPCYRHISGSDLLVCGDYVYNHYHDCQDANYHLVADKINDVLSLPSEKVRFKVNVTNP